MDCFSAAPASIRVELTANVRLLLQVGARGEPEHLCQVVLSQSANLLTGSQEPAEPSQGLSRLRPASGRPADAGEFDSLQKGGLMEDERANARAADSGNSRKERWHNSFCPVESRSVPRTTWKRRPGQNGCAAQQMLKIRFLVPGPTRTVRV